MSKERVTAESGRVYLIGAGPGDPELITVKGLRCLQSAEVVVYDRLANEELLDEVPSTALRIFAGKAPGAHTLSQAEINAVLLLHGSAGKRVVRLKAGDPYVFGRGGEEAEALRAAGVPFELVPGVTSAIAAPASAGIPVTHRDFTSAFTVVTGHEDPQKESSSIPWAALATGADTIIFLMGVSRLAQIAQQLLAHGRAVDTPVAVVRRGTWPDQQVVIGTLETIAARVVEVGLRSPAVTVVGQVATLSARLGWSGHYPLAGRRILVTRAREQASSLSALLASFGAEVLEYPAIRIEPLESYAELDSALVQGSRYQWACFTSVNAVAAVDTRLSALGVGWEALSGTRIAAIGPATARALIAKGCVVAYMPERFLAAEIAAGLPDAAGARILLARADIADERLVAGLQARGALVDQFPAYRTLVSDEAIDVLRSRLERNEIEIVTFASSSTVRNLCSALGADAPVLLGGTMVACIGPVTAGTARESGLEPAVIASEHTIPGLVRAIWEHMAVCT